MSADSNPLAPGLYLVATPIGNLGDITLRALEVLRAVDRIACEDTRQTQKLLNHFEIEKKTVSCHEHNDAPAPELIQDMKAGRPVALVSDAGTPGVSDPGSWLVREADQGRRVGIGGAAEKGSHGQVSRTVVHRSARTGVSRSDAAAHDRARREAEARQRWAVGACERCGRGAVLGEPMATAAAIRPRHPALPRLPRPRAGPVRVDCGAGPPRPRPRAARRDTRPASGGEPDRAARRAGRLTRPPIDFVLAAQTGVAALRA